MLVGLFVLLGHIHPLNILIVKLVRWGSGPLEDLVEVEDVLCSRRGDGGHGQGAGTWDVGVKYFPCHMSH